jgi:hypothetical protein
MFGDELMAYDRMTLEEYFEMVYQDAVDWIEGGTATESLFIGSLIVVPWKEVENNTGCWKGSV